MRSNIKDYKRDGLLINELLPNNGFKPFVNCSVCVGLSASCTLTFKCTTGLISYRLIPRLILSKAESLSII